MLLVGAPPLGRIIPPVFTNTTASVHRSSQYCACAMARSLAAGARRRWKTQRGPEATPGERPCCRRRRASIPCYHASSCFIMGPALLSLLLHDQCGDVHTTPGPGRPCVCRSEDTAGDNDSADEVEEEEVEEGKAVGEEKEDDESALVARREANVKALLSNRCAGQDAGCSEQQRGASIAGADGGARAAWLHGSS